MIRRVIFEHAQTPEGVRLEGVALGLGRTLRVSVTKLINLAPRGDSDESAKVTLTLTRAQQGFHGFVETGAIDSGIWKEADLVVVPTPVPADNLLAILPFSAHQIVPGSDRSLLIPFGNRDTALVAGHRAIPLAKMLGLRVVLYHTTYRRSDVSSDSPWHHMDSEAIAVQRQLVSWCESCGVSSEFHHEFADEVVAGILRAAVLHNASLIAVARGEHVKNGYTDRLCEQGFPLLLVGRHVEE